MLTAENINERSHWISVFEPLAHERQELIDKYEVTTEMLDYAIDPYEKARVEVDQNAGVTLLIFDVYVPTREISAPQTAPIGIMLTNNNVITFTNAQTNFVNGIFANELTELKDKGPIDDKIDLVLPVLYQLSTAYFEPIRRADSQRQTIQRNIHDRTNRKVISDFMEIETGLVYILTSLRGNVSLLQEFKRRTHLSDKQSDDLDDVLIEAQQGLEMAQMTSDVSARVSDAYSKVLDSELNQTMQFLTVFSIILAIPPIVSGFYGENVKLPLASGPYAWIFTIVVSVVLILGAAVVMRNRHWWR